MNDECSRASEFIYNGNGAEWLNRNVINIILGVSCYELLIYILIYLLKLSVRR